MKHTKGKVEVKNKMSNGMIDIDDAFAIVCDTNDNKEWDICAVWKDAGYNDEPEANANLIAEAFNVTNECGLTPRQLLEQRNELLRCLQFMIKIFEDDNATSYQCNLFIDSYKAINNTLKTEPC